MLIGNKIDIKLSKSSASLKMVGIGMGIFLYVEKYKGMIGEY